VMSHVAVGDQAIRDLILSIKNADPTNPLLHFPIANGNGIRRKIGQKIPEFSLEDMSGRKITNETLQDQSTLVTFWSPGCPHCRELISEIKDTEKRGLPDGLGMVIFSDGDPETHADLGLRLPIVLDKGFKVSAQMGITGTPSAVLVDEGVIVSETAVGGPNIWSLVRRAKV
jgi:peroxiredoxin